MREAIAVLDRALEDRARYERAIDEVLRELRYGAASDALQRGTLTLDEDARAGLRWVRARLEQARQAGRA